MKQDPNLTHGKGSESGNSKSSGDSSAKVAMDNYFDDIFGGFEEDPLKKLNAKQDNTNHRADSTTQNKSSPRKVKKDLGVAKVEFAERESKPLLQQVVIPAAFPKMAPEPETKGSVREKLSRKVVLEQEAAPEPVEIDAKKEDVPEELPLMDPPSQPERDSEPADTSETSVELALDQAEINEPAPWLENGQPAWGQERFECLLFTVAGLKLAVPLVSLGAIYKIENDFTPLVGRADWFMGLYQTQDRNVQVVDTAKWVMPDRYHDGVKQNYKFIIRLGGNNWGIACDQVHEAISLEPTQVRWRSERSKRPWLSGTVIDQMCALLDADTLSYLLQKDIRLH